MITLLDRLFARLPGVWTVAGAIEDSRFGAGRFGGEAVFTAQGGDALLCAEEGELVLGAWRGPAYRHWLYVHEEDGLSIFYPDGQTLLHQFILDAEGARAEHTHLCGEDQYHATLTLTEQGGFTLSYTVDGPSKRYFLNTMYERKAGTGNDVACEALIRRARLETAYDGYPL